MTITLTRANGNASDVIAQYATSDGTATAGQDYTAVNGSVVFGANETTRSFTIPIIKDSIRETDETINLSLTAIDGGATLGIPFMATIVIINDDRNSTVADFDGDGRADVSVFRPENGAWYLNQSSAGFAVITFGYGTDKLIPADYDGDGKTDIAVFRSGTWLSEPLDAGLLWHCVRSINRPAASECVRQIMLSQTSRIKNADSSRSAFLFEVSH